MVDVSEDSSKVNKVFCAPQLCRLDRKWVLWHEFMKEHAHLDAWLGLAEEAVTMLNVAHITYGASKEELRKFEVRRNKQEVDGSEADGPAAVC